MLFKFITLKKSSFFLISANLALFYSSDLRTIFGHYPVLKDIRISKIQFARLFIDRNRLVDRVVRDFLGSYLSPIIASVRRIHQANKHVWPEPGDEKFAHS